MSADERTADGLLSGRPRRAPRPMPVVVLADRSGSMDGEKIALLNHSIEAMFAAFASEDSTRGELHVAVVAFGGDGAELQSPMSPASRARWTPLVASGRTPMGGAFDLTRSLLDDPAVVPDRCFPPALVLVSDGAPTDAWEEPLDAMLSSRWGGKALRVAVGVGVDRTSDCEAVLTSFSTPGLEVLRTSQVHEIPGFLRWVTATVTGRFRERTGVQAVQLAELD